MQRPAEAVAGISVGNLEAKTPSEPMIRHLTVGSLGPGYHRLELVLVTTGEGRTIEWWSNDKMPAANSGGLIVLWMLLNEDSRGSPWRCYWRHGGFFESLSSLLIHSPSIIMMVYPIRCSPHAERRQQP